MTWKLDDYPIGARVRIGQCEGTVLRTCNRVHVQFPGVAGYGSFDPKFVHLVEQPDPMPVDSELRDRVAAAIHDSDAWVHHRTSTGVRTTDFYAQLADEALTAVAPVLAARDAELKFAGATRQQYAEERDLLLWLHAEAVWHRDCTQRVTDAYVAQSEKQWDQAAAVVERTRAERDEFAADVERLTMNLERAHAELHALKANAVVLPKSWKTQLGWLFDVHTEDTYKKVTRLVETWQGKRSGTADTESEVGQPDTEATTKKPPFQPGQLVRREDGDTYTVGGVEKCGGDWKVYDAHTTIAFYQWASNLELADATPIMVCSDEDAHPEDWPDCEDCGGMGKVRPSELASRETEAAEVDNEAIEFTASLRERVPATPTEPRVWRKGDPEPPVSIQVLVDCKDDHLPYLCRIPGSSGWWQWFERPADRLRAPGGVPWAEATDVMGSGAKDYVVAMPEFTEVILDGTQ